MLWVFSKGYYGEAPSILRTSSITGVCFFLTFCFLFYFFFCLILKIEVNYPESDTTEPLN